jgi:hypothetical protein
MPSRRLAAARSTAFFLWRSAGTGLSVRPCSARIDDRPPRARAVVAGGSLEAAALDGVRDDSVWRFVLLAC